jgi:hypothetical protein
MLFHERIDPQKLSFKNNYKVKLSINSVEEFLILSWGCGILGSGGGGSCEFNNQLFQSLLRNKLGGPVKIHIYDYESL